MIFNQTVMRMAKTMEFYPILQMEYPATDKLRQGCFGVGKFWKHNHVSYPKFAKISRIKIYLINLDFFTKKFRKKFQYFCVRSRLRKKNRTATLFWKIGVFRATAPHFPESFFKTMYNEFNVVNTKVRFPFSSFSWPQNKRNFSPYTRSNV